MEFEKQSKLPLDFKEIPMSEAPYTRTLRQALVDDFVPTMQWMRQSAFPEEDRRVVDSLPYALEWVRGNLNTFDKAKLGEFPYFVQTQLSTLTTFINTPKDGLDDKLPVVYRQGSFAWINEMYPFMLSTHAVHADLSLKEYRHLMSGEMDEEFKLRRYSKLGVGESTTDYRILLGHYIESGDKDAEQVLADFWCSNLYLHYRVDLKRRFGFIKDLQSK